LEPKWGNKRHYLQPDFVIVYAEEVHNLKGVGFLLPQYLHLDHRAIVADIWVGSQGRLKEYRRRRQKFPMTLPLEDGNTG
jgi:hypothetical protein